MFPLLSEGKFKVKFKKGMKEGLSIYFNMNDEPGFR